MHRRSPDRKVALPSVLSTSKSSVAFSAARTGLTCCRMRGHSRSSPDKAAVGQSTDRITPEAREPAMTGARDILGTVALEPTFDIEELSVVLQALTDLDRASTACAAAMIAEDDAADMISAVRADLDCADIAAAAQRVLSRGTAMDLGVVRAVLQAAVAASERSAAECGRHARHHAHCRVQAESARRAAELCRSVLEGLAG
jgi:hypothetical protein